MELEPPSDLPGKFGLWIIVSETDKLHLKFQSMQNMQYGSKIELANFVGI